MVKRACFICIALLVGLAAAGCIKSRMLIMSEPSGAEVTVNNEVKGTTPCVVPFDWYWYYDIALRKEGYEPLESRERLRAPIYFTIPLDLFWELMPFNIKDTHSFYYIMDRETAGEQRETTTQN